MVGDSPSGSGRLRSGPCSVSRAELEVLLRAPRGSDTGHSPTRLWVATSALLFVLLAGLCSGCGCNAGVQRVTIRPGSYVYLKVQNDTLILSANKNACARDPAVDYILDVVPRAPFLYYRLEPDAIVIDGYHWRSPARNAFGKTAVRFEGIPQWDVVVMTRLRNWEAKGWNRWDVTFDTFCLSWY
jgi:hypothetical protein